MDEQSGESIEKDVSDAGRGETRQNGYFGDVT